MILEKFELLKKKDIYAILDGDTDFVEYKNNKYIADIEVTYSTRASELIGVPKSNGTITYTKNIDNNILLEDFIINK